MAARRRPPEPPPIEVKHFASPEEIDAAIAKLKRRIDEVQSLDPTRVRYDDQRVYTAQDNIHTTILEIFGPNSPEYQRYQYHTITRGGLVLGAPPERYQRGFAEGIPQTVTMLEGLIARLEERRAEFGANQTVRARAAFEGLDLHPRIATACAALYRDRHYGNAVLNASLALVTFVKEKSGRFDLDGAPLMMEVFSANNPRLAFNNLADQTEKDEQQGMMFLFAGAVLALRNPRAHRLLQDSPQEALDYIAFLSMLARQVERAAVR